MQWKERSDTFEREFSKLKEEQSGAEGGHAAGGSLSNTSTDQQQLLRHALRSLHNVVCSYAEVAASLCEAVLNDAATKEPSAPAASNPFALSEAALQLPRLFRGSSSPSLDSGSAQDTAVLVKEAVGWDPTEKHGRLIASLLEAKAKLASKSSVKPDSLKPPSASEADENSIDTLKQALSERNALLRSWEQYANHWENRGREAERLNEDWEQSFDALQMQYSNLALEHAELIRSKGKLKGEPAGSSESPASPTQSDTSTDDDS